MNNPKTSTGPLFIACFVTFVLYIGAYMRIPLIPLYAKYRNASPSEVGLINFLFMLAAAAVAFPMGISSDRWGRRRMMLTGIFLSGLTSLVVPFCKTPLQIMLFYLFGGVGIASFTPSIMSYIGDISSPGFIGRAYGYYTTSLYAGMSLGPAIGGFIASKYTLETSFFVSSAIIALIFIVAITLLRDVKNPGDKISINRTSITEIVRKPAINRCWIATLCLTFTWGVSITFFPLFAHEKGVSAFLIGVIFAFQALFNTIVRLPVGRLSDRMGMRIPFIIVGMLGSALSTLSIVLSERVINFILFSSVLGISMGMSFVIMGSLLTEESPQNGRGFVMGGFSTAIYTGIAMSSLVGGKIIEVGGYVTAFFIASFASVLGSILFLTLYFSRVQAQAY